MYAMERVLPVGVHDTDDVVFRPVRDGARREDLERCLAADHAAPIVESHVPFSHAERGVCHGQISRGECAGNGMAHTDSNGMDHRHYAWVSSSSIFLAQNTRLPGAKTA